ncbi:MAG: SPASM domain-containing protein [Planctomycetes bacterium]|nr:SPASM domain-containing protein [Planctomycetota bacterium]
MLAAAFAHLRRLFAVYTPRRLYNLAMAEIAMRCRWSRLPYRPAKITIEPGNVCNLACPLCPTGQADNPSPKGMLTFENFQRILDQAWRDAVLVRLYNWGEPLLNKDLMKMLAYAGAKRVEVRLSLNLNILKPGQADEIMRHRIEKVFVSCDGTTQETYERYRVGGKIDKVFENMRELAAAKKRRRNHTAKVIWLFHIFRHNQHQVEEARRMARDLGVILRVQLARTDMGREIFETADQAKERDGHWLPTVADYNIFAPQNAPRSDPPCKSPWRETVFNWDGGVLPCCSVPDSRFALGNAVNGSFNDVWNGEKYQHARREILGQTDNCKGVCHACRLSGYRFAL